MATSVSTGRLEDEALPSLLQALFSAQATGVLRIASRQGAHEIYLRQGYPVMITLPGAAEPIGKVLHEMGVLDAATYKKSLAEPTTPGLRYGAVLIKKGWATADQVRLGLKAQVRRKLHRLFFLSDGEFKYEEGEHREGMEGQESLRVHPWRAIYHGVRSAWSNDRLAGALFLLNDRALHSRGSERETERNQSRRHHSRTGRDGQAAIFGGRDNFDPLGNAQAHVSGIRFTVDLVSQEGKSAAAK